MRYALRIVLPRLDYIKPIRDAPWFQNLRKQIKQSMHSLNSKIWSWWEKTWETCLHASLLANSRYISRSAAIQALGIAWILFQLLPF